MSTDSEHRYALPPGHRLGEYRIERYLGAGGFGITYLATVGNLDIQVAIKEYLPSDLATRAADHSVVVKTAGDEDDFQWGRERFLDEARSLARFDHPNIVRVQRFFEAHGTSYIVMDYVEGEPMSERLQRKGTLTEAEIREQVLPLAQGLAEIHTAGLLHRDIKPSNIIVGKDGTPVLIDFGSARQAVGAKSRSVTSVVTPGYAPLEQYTTRSKQGPATDTYALGAVLYLCVTGKVPADAASRGIDDRLTPVAEAVKGNYSADLLGAIDSALAVRMEDRPSDVAAFLGGLGESDAKTPHIPHREEAEGLSESERSAIQDTPGSAKEQTRYGQWLYVLLASGLALAVLIVLGVFVFRGAQETESASGVEAKSDWEAALDAYDRGDYLTALREFQRLAERGDASAQYALGEMYDVGEGVPEDDAQAAYWYRKAAEQGDASAQYALGAMYAVGEGVPEDDAQAAYWYRKAAEQGDAWKQAHLGNMYALGVGVPQDHAQAAYWYRKAAEQGDAGAQVSLGNMYAAGEGVPEDDAQAASWYRKAAEQGDAWGQARLGDMYAAGEGVPEDDAQAASWYRKAAEQGNAWAQYDLGVMYYNGNVVPKDDVQAYAWFNLSAARGNEVARTNKDNLGERMTPSQISEAQALSRDLEATIQE